MFRLMCLAMCALCVGLAGASLVGGLFAAVIRGDVYIGLLLVICAVLCGGLAQGFLFVAPNRR